MKNDYLSASNACHENWNQMTPTEKGAFCKSCKKEVFNFRELSVASVYKKIEEKDPPCIRVSKAQMDALNFNHWYDGLPLFKQISYLFIFAYVLTFSPSIFSQQTDYSFIPEISIEEGPFPQNEPIHDVIKKKDVTEDTITHFSTPNLNETPWIPMGNIGWMGIPPVNIFPTSSIDFQVINSYTDLFIPIDSSKIVPTIKSIVLNQNNYAFEISENQFIFTFKTKIKETIHLKISNEANQLVYSNTIAIPEGEGTKMVDISEFNTGNYSIKITNNQLHKQLDILYKPTKGS